jgi:hypothetical protein
MSHGSHDRVPEPNRSEKIPWYWVLASRIYFEGTPSIFSTSILFYHKPQDCCNSIWNILPNTMPARIEQYLLMEQLQFWSMRILQPSRTRPPSRSRHVEVQEADSTSSLSQAWALQALPEFESGPIEPEFGLTEPQMHSTPRHHSKGTSPLDIILIPLFGHRDLRRANWKREQIRVRTGPLPMDFRTEVRYHCSIELAEKVIDDEERPRLYPTSPYPDQPSQRSVRAGTMYCIRTPPVTKNLEEHSFRRIHPSTISQCKRAVRAHGSWR